MKLKHRKLILIISMSAMSVGLITFSVAENKDKKAAEVVSADYLKAAVADEITQAPTSELTDTPTPNLETTISPTPTEETSDEVTETPTPTPTEAAAALEEDGNADVNKLVKNFLQAKLDGKAKKLKKLVTDSSYIDIDMIQKKTEFIESYDNIKVYTMPGKGDIDYIAYVYMEVKIASIDTKAPGLNELYIKKVDDSYKIVLGKISDDTASYIAECRESEAVQDLLKDVNKKLKKAMKKDEALAEFCNKLDATPTPKKD